MYRGEEHGRDVFGMFVDDGDIIALSTTQGCSRVLRIAIVLDSDRGLIRSLDNIGWYDGGVNPSLPNRNVLIFSFNKSLILDRSQIPSEYQELLENHYKKYKEAQ